MEIKEKDTDRENENGIVLEQSISDKKVEAGTSITIYVGKYVKPIVLINLDELGIKGKKVSEARGILEAKGLKVVFANGGVDEANDIVSGYTPS